MHQVVEIEYNEKKLPEEGRAAAEDYSSVEEMKWLGRSLVLIRWVVRGILIHAWASNVLLNYHNFKPSAWAALSAFFTCFSLLLYASSFLYLRFFFARHGHATLLASVSFNRCFALFNLLWALLLLLIGLASTSLGLLAAEDINILSLFFYPHAVIAHLFIHLLLTSRPPQAAPPPPPHKLEEEAISKRTICFLFLQILLLLLWILYPIARILDSHYLTSPYVFTFFILTTLVATISFIVFFCSAIALVFLGHEEFPTLL